MNPLHRLKYDAREFHVWNWAVKRSIQSYDEIPKRYPKELKNYPIVEGEDGPLKPCSVVGCGGLLTHLRSNLCTRHREERRAATKRVRKTPPQQPMPS